MRKLAAKFAFVHRTLWKRDQAYRWAALLGPPPLVGCGLATLVLAIIHQLGLTTPAPVSSIPWAHWNRPMMPNGQPIAEAPTAPMPPIDANGRVVGFQPGWQVGVQPMTVDATFEAAIVGSILATFTLDQPTIPLARIAEAGPPTGLFVGAAKAFFPVSKAGVYAFSVRLTRSSTQSANCLVRLESAHHQMVRNINVNANGQAVLAYPPTEFQLEPGLFLLTVVVGCWRGDHMVGPGDVIVTVRHPGESVLQPVIPDEVIRPMPRRPDQANPKAAPPSH